jgi:rhodanese-related sulfurtransferase
MPDEEVIAVTSCREVREALFEKLEIALLDVREEGPHATGHPLFAANMPLGRIELEAYMRLPRKDVQVVAFDNGEELAEKAAAKFRNLGYSNVSLLEGNLQGWKDAGYEIFTDVNAPSKAFGELVEVERGTPSFSAHQVQQMIDSGEDCVIVDARRYDEFQTMSIPTGVSVPGAELVLRIRSLVPKPQTQVIVNCAGRTRSIIGAQSLINAGIPNPVAALRNGAIGWRLAQQSLAHGASATFTVTDESERLAAEGFARTVAERAGLEETTPDEVQSWCADQTRTTYLFDVRTPSEYVEGHLPGFRSAPGGQLVQETDMFAPVRGARIVLCDTDGVRGRMTGSWLRQMGWDARTLSNLPAERLTENGPFRPALPSLTPVPKDLEFHLDEVPNPWQRVAVLDFSPGIVYRAGHFPDSFFASRDHLKEVLTNLADVDRYIVTASDPALAYFAWNDLRNATSKPVFLNRSVIPGDHLTKDNPRYACTLQDRYMRPYEGTAASEQAMQAYLDWEAGLVEQLERDGTHHFFVI